MAPVPPNVPRATYKGAAAKEHLIVTVDRMLYVLAWISENPTDLLDGRHHDNLRRALQELHKLLEKPLPPPHEGTWKDTLKAVSDDTLPTIGLDGDQLALKVAIFNQFFDEFLDIIGKRGSNNVKLPTVEQFLINVSPWYKKLLRRRGRTAARALSAGNTILSSLSLVPGLEKVCDAVTEVSEFVQHGIEYLETKW